MKSTTIFCIFNALMAFTTMVKAAYLFNPMAKEEAGAHPLTGVHENDRYTAVLAGNPTYGYKNAGAYLHNGLSSNSETGFSYAGRLVAHPNDFLSRAKGGLN